MDTLAAASSPAPRLLFLVTEDWYFCSHRLPMARAARDAGFEVVVATRVADHGAPIRAEGFRLHPLGWRRRAGPLAELRALVELVRLYRRERPAVVHHVALKPVVFGSLAARLAALGDRAAAPATVNALAGLGHGFAGTTWRGRQGRALLSWVLGRLIDRPRALTLFQNPDDRDRLVARGIVAHDRTRLVRGSGIELDHYQPLPPPSPDPPGAPVICAAVARMLRSKGIPTAIEALRRARARGVALELWLVGAPDPDSPSSLSMAELEAWASEPGLRWLGHVADVRTVWRDAAIALLPSTGGEGVPKCLLEAAACARPIVATDVPGCREIVQPGVNGVLVPPGDAAALADALAALAADPARRTAWGAAGRRLVESDLAADAVGRAVVALYRELLDGAPAPGAAP